MYNTIEDKNMTDPIQGNIIANRLVSKTDLKDTKAKKADGDNNTVWHTDIKGYDEKQLAMQFMAKTIKNTGYALFDRNLGNDKKDGRLSKEQEDFLLKNQIEKDTISEKDGTSKSVYVNQKDQGDKKLTKGELFNSIELRKSLANVDPKNLSQDEKEFIKGFDSCFGQKGTDGTQPFTADFRDRGVQPIYHFVEGQPPYKPAELKEEKNLIVELGKGKTTLMSEKEGYGSPDKHLEAHKLLPVWNNYTYPDSKYSNVDNYINKLPKDIEKFYKDQSKKDDAALKEDMKRDYTPIVEDIRTVANN